MAKMELKDFIIYKFCIGKQMTKTVFILVESEEHNILKKEKKKKEIETEKKTSKKRRNHTIEWEKLDNTANLFPAIATQNMTNVYRISVTLKEEIQGAVLQLALDKVLERFDTFRVRMRKGIFWYYFETNTKPAPTVYRENDYPCRYIEPYENNNYLFRLTYYKKRINLEVFHVLADGMGGMNFLREITYQYLRLIHKEISNDREEYFSDDTSLNTEDSYLKNFRKSHKKSYRTQKAIHLKGEKTSGGELSVIHGFMDRNQIKEVCKRYDASVNEYLTAVFTYSIYMEYLHGQPAKRPIVICIPVNLRPYFDSMTTRNFFAMVSASFLPEQENMTLDEVVRIVKESLRSQINKEHLEEIFSYNVSNQKNILLRSVPIFIKAIAMRLVYISSARASTSTITNLGKIAIDEKYQKYIAHFTAMISRSAGQIMKGAVCSYQDVLSFTFTSALKDLSVERCFFRTLAKDGIKVAVETNLE